MELASHTSTTITTDKRQFKSTAPSGELYYTTLTTTTLETNIETPIPLRDTIEPPRRRLKTTIRTTTRRQLHRVAPYPGAHPVRVSSRSNTTTTANERIVLLDEE